MISVCFAGSFLLMLFCTFVRWVVAIPFNLTIVLYDLM
jgi:hypothetical protein